MSLVNLSVFFALCGGTSERHDSELDFLGVSVHEGAHHPAGVLQEGSSRAWTMVNGEGLASVCFMKTMLSKDVKLL